MSLKRTLPLVYSCSGCSAAAQTANQVALALDRSGAAEMSCIAGVGGGVAPLVRLAASERDIIALDGCPLQCVKSCLSRHDVRPTVHYVLNRLGVKKGRHTGPEPRETERVLEVVLRDLDASSRRR